MNEMRPQIWIVAGPNGAGKTSLTTARLAGKIPIVNPDVIAQELPRISGRLDERRAGQAAINEREGLISAGETFAIETTLSGHGTLLLMKKAGTAGYKVNLVFVGLDEPELAVMRVADRVAQGGHDVPRDAIVRRFDDAMTRLASAVAISDRCYVFDNSGIRRTLLLVREGHHTLFAAANIPPWAGRALDVDIWKSMGGTEGSSHAAESGISGDLKTSLQ